MDDDRAACFPVDAIVDNNHIPPAARICTVRGFENKHSLGHQKDTGRVVPWRHQQMQRHRRFPSRLQSQWIQRSGRRSHSLILGLLYFNLLSAIRGQLWDETETVGPPRLRKELGILSVYTEKNQWFRYNH